MSLKPSLDEGKVFLTILAQFGGETWQTKRHTFYYLIRISYYIGLSDTGDERICELEKQLLQRDQEIKVMQNMG